MITMEEILNGRAKLDELPVDIQDNLKHQLEVMNAIRTAYGCAMTLTSGYRRPEDNAATSNAAKKSAHMTGQACDVRDTDGALMRWTLDNLQLMQDLGVYIEDFRWTRSKTKGYWVHFGTRRPASGKRIFIPSSAPPESPDCWDGTYDAKYND